MGHEAISHYTSALFFSLLLQRTGMLVSWQKSYQELFFSQQYILTTIDGCHSEMHNYFLHSQILKSLTGVQTPLSLPLDPTLPVGAASLSSPTQSFQSSQASLPGDSKASYSSNL